VLTHGNWIKNVKEWFKNKKFSDNLINKMIENSKRINWPQGFNTQDKQAIKMLSIKYLFINYRVLYY